MLKIIQESHKLSPQIISQAQKAVETLLQRTDIGFAKVPTNLNWVKDIEAKSSALKGNYKKFVVVGLGGSSLGARAIQEVFGLRNLFFVDNVDAIHLERTLASMQNLDDVLWLFISKSGSTIETLFLLDALRVHLLTQGIELEKNSVVISEDTANPLRSWAIKNQRPCLDFPKDVGGRFSVLTCAGMLPAALCGLIVDDFYQGAREALDAKSLVAQLTAQFYESFDREEWITQFWFYNSSMQSFSRWLVQLWSESLAKSKGRIDAKAARCSTPMACIGSTDQHSTLQQLADGARDKFAIFHSFEEIEGAGHSLSEVSFSELKLLKNKKMGDLLRVQILATEEALRQEGVSTMLIRSKVLDEKSLGFLFMTYELVVGSLGEMMNLDAYDQPGVELGKRLTLKKLSNL